MKNIIKKLGISVITMLIVINLIKINSYAENNITNENVTITKAENKEEIKNETTNSENKTNSETTKTESKTNNETTKSTTNTKTTSTSKLTEVTVDGTKYKDGDRINVDNSKNSVRIYGVGESLIYIKVNDKGSTVDVNLVEGENKIVVTDSKGGKVTLYITRATAGTTNTIENTTVTNEIAENVTSTEDVDNSLKLSSLNIEGIKISPSFNENTYSYTATINMNEKDYSSLIIKAVPSRTDATVTIDGNEELVEGENIINIIVKSNDSSEIKTYQLVVNKTRQEIVPEPKKTDSKLNIAIIAVVALIIVVAIVLIIRKIKNKNEENNEYSLYNYDLYDEPLKEKYIPEYKESKEKQEIEEIPDITYVEELPSRKEGAPTIRRKKTKGKHA